METVSPGFYSIDFVPFFRTEIKVDTKKKIQKLAQKPKEKNCYKTVSKILENRNWLRICR